MAGVSPTAPLPDDITEMNIEELMSVDVVITTISRKEQTIQDTGSAVFVISEEDIRRSGATNIPDLLRMVPGFYVSQINNTQSHLANPYTWAISSRGFHSQFSTKLLVLLDGRSIFSSITTVNWRTLNIVMEDIQRIEIIRGSAAALWGPSAVNGVINIITKEAEKTKDWLIAVGSETETYKSGTIRYGGNINNDTYYKIYTRYVDAYSPGNVSDLEMDYKQDVVRSGIRIDKTINDHDFLSVHGDIYWDHTDFSSLRNSLTQYMVTYDSESAVFGGDLMCRWKHLFPGNSELIFQMYYDQTGNDINQISPMEENNDPLDRGYMYDEETVDFDVQHEFHLNKKNDVIWGAGVRYTKDSIKGTSYMTISPEERTTTLLSAFLQDDMTLIQNTLKLNLGAKFEHNDYTGFEIQPNMRLLWIPSQKQTIWASIAQSMRTPLRIESDAQYIGYIPRELIYPHLISGSFIINGNPDIEPEEIYSYEMGYRVRTTRRFYFDLALYYNIYKKLFTAEPGDLSVNYSPEPHLVLPFYLTNRSEAEAIGGEVTFSGNLMSWWHIASSYAYIEFELDYKGIDKSPIFIQTNLTDFPKHQISFQSTFNLSKTTLFDIWVRHVDEMPSEGLEGYTSVDAQIRWNMFNGFYCSISGKNLNGPHVESITKDLFKFSTEVDRSYHFKIEWRF